MRLPGFTIVLAIATIVLGVVAAWRWREGGLDTLLGAPPVAVGQPLYPALDLRHVAAIRIDARDSRAQFVLRDDGWHAVSPWADRMDPRAAAAILGFAAATRVEDHADAFEIDAAQTGLDDKAVHIRLLDRREQVLAAFKLGRQTPWKAQIEGAEAPVATLFVQPLERHRDGTIYICTGDIGPLFKDGLRLLRDHRPFHLPPQALSRIRIRTGEGDLTLERSNPAAAWHIAKPLDQAADPAAVRTMIDGLMQLQALQVSDRAEVTVPAAEKPVQSTQIAVSMFGSDREQVLDVLPDESAERATPVVLATVSDRPGVVFELPSAAGTGRVTLDGLPLGLDALRDPSLARIDVAALQSVSIRPATSRDILLVRDPGRPWMATIGGQTREANEGNLYRLLKALTETRAESFESDAATDFAPWGLERPILTLEFGSRDGRSQAIRFGIDGAGRLFANPAGSPTVMRLDPKFLESIAIAPHEWRHERPWSIDRVNLIALERSMAAGASVALEYDFLREEWRLASPMADQPDASVDRARADFVLAALENLRVARWLAPDDAAALTALASPAMVIRIREKSVSDAGEFTGFTDRRLMLAPAGPGDDPPFHYGGIAGDPQPFLIDRDTWRKLTTGIFE